MDRPPSARFSSTRLLSTRFLANLALPAALLLPLTALVACGPSSPEEAVAAKRADYTIELNSWRIVEEEPAAPVEGEGEEEGEADASEDTAETGEAAGEAAAGEETADEETTPEETGPQPVDVELDLVIFFRGSESLPGVTVDITHADANQQEKEIFRHYVETEGIVKGETRQAAFVIEDVLVEEGDIFAASVKPGIPAELGEYREFSSSP